MGLISDTVAVETINWRSFEEGLVVGKAEKKKVFLHFYADWCVFCAKMAKETFQNPAVVSYLNNNFIPVRVDTDKEPATAMKYGVTGASIHLVFNRDGRSHWNRAGLYSAGHLVGNAQRGQWD